MTASKLSELFASYQLSEPPERPELTNGNAYWFIRSAADLKGKHINEVHITANATQHMYVDVNVVAGGRAEDYVDQIMSAFSSAASVFSKFSGEPEGDVLAGIYKTLVASLTDRAVVNHKTKIDLEEAVNSQLDGLNLLLSEYNCNLHPLDSIASAVRKALKVIYPPVLI